jgi:hypothetical protein
MEMAPMALFARTGSAFIRTEPMDKVNAFICAIQNPITMCDTICSRTYEAFHPHIQKRIYDIQFVAEELVTNKVVTSLEDLIRIVFVIGYLEEIGSIELTFDY